MIKKNTRIIYTKGPQWKFLTTFYEKKSVFKLDS